MARPDKASGGGQDRDLARGWKKQAAKTRLRMVRRATWMPACLAAGRQGFLVPDFGFPVPKTKEQEK